MNLKAVYKNHKEVIVYVIVGVLTTIVSWGACLIAKLFLDSNDKMQNFLINSIGWIAGVLFAYPLNRKWVFMSKNEHVLKEFCGFATSRLSTWILDILIMWLMVNVWSLDFLLMKICNWFGNVPTPETIDEMNYWVAKICVSSVLVTFLNYIFSKLLVFRGTSNSD